MDSSLSLYQELHPQQMTLPDYLRPEVWTQATTLARNEELQTLVQRMTRMRLTSLGAVTTTFRIAQLAASSQTQVSVFYSRDFNIRQMKSDNVVLLGSSDRRSVGDPVGGSVEFPIRI